MPSWTCTVCGQVVELRDDDRPRWPVKAYENCELQHHYVDHACIAYAHPQVAKELSMMALSRVRDRPVGNMDWSPEFILTRAIATLGTRTGPTAQPLYPNPLI